MPDALPPDNPNAARQRWMAVLARASGQEIDAHLQSQGPLPSYQILRGPEIGLVMVRGRAGDAFNLGEMTVTRCTVRTESGGIGHAYVAGRDAQQAELAALLDALLQDADHNTTLQATVIAPLEAEQRARRALIASRAAATKVQFFAMRNMRT